MGWLWLVGECWFREESGKVAGNRRSCRGKRTASDLWCPWYEDLGAVTGIVGLYCWLGSMAIWPEGSGGAFLWTELVKVICRNMCSRLARGATIDLFSGPVHCVLLILVMESVTNVQRQRPFPCQPLGFGVAGW